MVEQRLRDLAAAGDAKAIAGLIQESRRRSDAGALLGLMSALAEHRAALLPVGEALAEASRNTSDPTLGRAALGCFLLAGHPVAARSPSTGEVVRMRWHDCAELYLLRVEDTRIMLEMASPVSFPVEVALGEAWGFVAQICREMWSDLVERVTALELYDDADGLLSRASLDGLRAAVEARGERLSLDTRQGEALRALLERCQANFDEAEARWRAASSGAKWGVEAYSWREALCAVEAVISRLEQPLLRAFEYVFSAHAEWLRIRRLRHIEGYVTEHVSDLDDVLTNVKRAHEGALFKALLLGEEPPKEM